MPRRPRIDMVGHYHIVDRGVEQRVVFLDDDDFEMFLSLLCTGCQLYSVKAHVYVMMSNHISLAHRDDEREPFEVHEAS